MAAFLKQENRLDKRLDMSLICSCCQGDQIIISKHQNKMNCIPIIKSDKNGLI